MRVELHRAVPDDPALRQAWNALVDRMERPEVFYTHEWAGAVSHAYGESLRPWVLLAYDGAELAGVAALALDAENRARFLAGTTADYCDLVSSPQDRGALVELLLTKLRDEGIRDIVLPNLPEDSATVPVLSRLARGQGYYVGQRLGYVCARVELGSSEQRSGLKSAIRKKKSYRYNMNALAREGPVVVSHLSSWAEVEPMLPEFYVAHVARFLAMQGVSNLARRERRSFLTELARRLSESGWLTLTRMTLGDRPVAWNYGFRFHDSWFYYQPTFDSGFERYSPGVCLLSGIIVDGCESPDLQMIDLGLGAEGYKERFADGSRKTLYVTLSQSRWRPVREGARFRLAATVKRSPRLESLVRGVLGKNDGRDKSGSVRQEMLFYEWTKPVESLSPKGRSSHLVPIDLQILAKAIMLYEDDVRAQAYLLQAAQRLSASGQGFAMINDHGDPVEFCWVGAFDGLQTHSSTPGPGATLIHDVFMPDAVRSSGPSVMSAVAERLQEEGRCPWASVGADDTVRRAGIEKAGFVFRYTTR